MDICIDENDLWFALDFEGIAKYNKIKKEWRFYGKKDFPFFPCITNVLSSGRKFIWAGSKFHSCPAPVVRFNKKEQKWEELKEFSNLDNKYKYPFTLKALKADGDNVWMVFDTPLEYREIDSKRMRYVTFKYNEEKDSLVEYPASPNHPFYNIDIDKDYIFFPLIETVYSKKDNAWVRLITSTVFLYRRPIYCDGPVCIDGNYLWGGGGGIICFDKKLWLEMRKIFPENS